MDEIRAQAETPRQSNAETARSRTEALARGLGWFSVGLGAAELFAPGGIAGLIGAGSRHHGLLRAYGAREFGAGMTILGGSPTTGVWARVGGDLMDLASLGAALGSRHTDRGKAAAALAAVAGVTALDAFCAVGLSRARAQEGARTVRASVVVNKSPEECYAFWHNFDNLPRFLSFVRSVAATGDRRTHWVAGTPHHRRFEWDAELVEDVPNERIAWATLPGSGVENCGCVRFERALGDHGTIVRVDLEYGRPGRALGAAFARIVGRDPEQLLHKDMRRFKQLLETGEVLTTEGQPSGRNHGATWLDHIAR
ncbi:MAG: SRPBCC family protein [Acidobacteria bacterium]|nr:SRPBCC family protein [Acidobacteriota bacterium]